MGSIIRGYGIHESSLNANAKCKCKVSQMKYLGLALLNIVSYSYFLQGISPSLFSLYRDENGDPLTPLGDDGFPTEFNR